jgi:hypothetical protein
VSAAAAAATTAGRAVLLLAGIVKGLVEVVKTAQKEKVVRVGLLSLRNLLVDGDAIMASDMVDAGLAKVVASRAMQVGPAQLGFCLGGLLHVDTFAHNHTYTRSLTTQRWWPHAPCR